jgi:tetraacyldisaccharide 4'-kinase
MSGDEPVMMSNILLKAKKNNFFSIACSDRVNAAEYMVNKFHPDLIILDDGFQHRKIKRNLDIVLIDAQDFSKNVFRNMFTIPSGNLRENIANLKRADLIIQNNKQDSLDLIQAVSNFTSDLISIRYKTEYIMDSKNSILSKEELKNKQTYVFSGLADNGSFIKQLENFGINITGHSDFPDHYDYKEKDIAHFKSIYKEQLIYVTTEKDFVKVVKFKEFISDYPVYFLKIGIELNDNNYTLIKMLDEAVK